MRQNLSGGEALVVGDLESVDTTLLPLHPGPLWQYLLGFLFMGEIELPNHFLRTVIIVIYPEWRGNGTCL